MKKLFILLLIFFSMNVWAEETNAIQLLVPKTVCVGDTAEIQYVFRSDIDFFPEQNKDGSKNTLNLNTDFSVFNSLSDECLVKSVLLERTGYEYTLVLTVVPWQPGIIDFPPFDLLALTKHSLYGDDSNASDYKGTKFLINLDAFAVDSIVEKTGETSFRPPVPPLIIPGTTWIIYGLIILIIIAIVLIIIFIRKIPFIKSSYNSFLNMISFKKNARFAIKHFKRLLKSELSDSDFCCELQNTMRFYLERRFNCPFTTETTNNILDRFDELMGGALSPEQESCVQTLSELFARTDYIRYAGGSADALRKPAERYAASFAPGEKKSIGALAVQIVISFEGKSKNTVQEGVHDGV